MPERSFPGDQGAEMRNMAEGTEKKGNCFARCPLFCCVLMSALLLVSLIVAGLSAGLYVELVSPAVDHAVAENVVLTPGSAGLSQFMSSSAPLYSYYYMYDITNPKGAQNGEKPELRQIGPFVYKENRTKYCPSWEDEHGGNTSQDILKYSMMINYTWDEALSHALDPKKTFVTNINIPLVGVLLALENLEDGTADGWKKKLLDEAINLINKLFINGEGLFTTRSVHDLLWGYEDPLLKDIKRIQDDINKLPGVHFDFVDQTTFGFGNLSSVESPNRVYTGANDTRRVAEFIQWDDHYNISGWGSHFAGEIRGTGGFMFHPGVTRNENLTAFINELYRSGYFAYENDVYLYGIQLYKFELPKEELVNTSQDPGFYANGPSGVLNLTAVVPSNLPLFASKPHFLDGDPDYRRNVSGLSPKRDIHDSYLSVEPLTGAVLDAAKRIQVNLRLTEYSHLSELAKVPPVTMLPVYWVAQTGTITPDLAAEFKSAVYTVEYGIEGGMWALTGIAGIVAVMSVLCLIGIIVQLVKKHGRGRIRRNQRRVINSETSPLLTADI